MNRVIPFYVPNGYRPKARAKGIDEREPARIIEFRAAKTKKPA